MWFIQLVLFFLFKFKYDRIFCRSILLAILDLGLVLLHVLYVIDVKLSNSSHLFWYLQLLEVIIASGSKIDASSDQREQSFFFLLFCISA